VCCSVAVCCSVLQTTINLIHSAYAIDYILQCVAVLQCVADNDQSHSFINLTQGTACCSVLQCDAVC